MDVILGIVIIGALLGFFFSSRGNEMEGAIQGAKKSCGCIIIFILAIIILGAMLGGAN